MNNKEILPKKREGNEQDTEKESKREKIREELRVVEGD